MESTVEGGGGDGQQPQMGCAEVPVAAGGLRRSEMFHVMKEIVGFVLYMHQQIPSVLQHLENEFDDLKEERKNLEESLISSFELRPSLRRIQTMRIRQVKMGIRRMEKLMSAISSMLSCLQLILERIDCFHGAILVLGSSLARPQQIYEVLISNGHFLPKYCTEKGRSQLAEVLSRKVVRALLSKGVGSSSYTGPTKLYLLVKAPTTLDLPQQFIPKRNFVFSKKIMPFRLDIKCKISEHGMEELCCAPLVSAGNVPSNFPSQDLIWFQCKNTVKGLAGRNTQLEG